MKEKKFTEKAKQFWDRNGRVIKTGIVCTLFGVTYGFMKGVVATADICEGNYNRGRVDQALDDSKNETESEKIEYDDPDLKEMADTETVSE